MAASACRHSFPQPSMPVPHYETSDVYLASFLLCQGGTLLNCQRVGARRNVFIFTSDAKLHELLRLYWSNVQVTFAPALLFSSLKRLKSLSRLQSQGTSDAPQPDADTQSTDGLAGTLPSSGKGPDVPSAGA